MEDKIRITQIRSGIGRMQQHKDTLKALGIRKMGGSVIQQESPSITGMINSVKHLVRIEKVKGE